MCLGQEYSSSIFLTKEKAVIPPIQFSPDPTNLAHGMAILQTRGINLSCIRTCVVVAEERPRIALQQSFSKLFKDIGLSPRAVSTTFGSRVNVAICLQVMSKSCLLANKEEMWGAPSIGQTAGLEPQFFSLLWDFRLFILLFVSFFSL